MAEQGEEKQSLGHGKAGRARSQNRCGRCALPIYLCLCSELRLRTISTRLVLLTHQKELCKTTNSGRLLKLILRDVEIRARGLKDQPLNLLDLKEHQGPKFLLFPSADSVLWERSLIKDDGRALLVIPDGTWRQARKVVTRQSELADFQRVHLAPGPPSRYRLRKTDDPSRLCTYEAVARALSVLEGESLQFEMEQLLELFVERFLWTRGQLSAKDVQGGIPEAALEEQRRLSMEGE